MSMSMTAASGSNAVSKPGGPGPIEDRVASLLETLQREVKQDEEKRKQIAKTKK